ncbi:hypothetical protein [Kitasatospora sp. NPDC098663]|uniref:hypothetical protein n=1 Tax=Kitasatospora sp. NPDC098663 TaxID=3364096 RepID=UPI0037F78585
MPDPARDLAQLADRLAEPFQDHDTVARHAEAVFGRDGALARLAAVTNSLAGWAARLDHRPGDDLSDALTDQARLLDGMHRQLIDTAVRIRALETVSSDDRTPSSRSQAATATTKAHQTAGKPAEAPPAVAAEIRPSQAKNRR